MMVGNFEMLWQKDDYGEKEYSEGEEGPIICVDILNFIIFGLVPQPVIFSSS